MEILKFAELIYPEMREELISHLEALSDLNYQRDVWVNHIPRDGVVYDEMDYAIHFIYDDTCLAKKPFDAIGFYLMNAKEVHVIHSLVNALDEVFAIYGLTLTDAEYIDKPEWKGVIEQAPLAKELMKPTRY